MNKLYLFLFVAILAIGCKKDASEEEAPKQEYIDSIFTIEGADIKETAFEYTSKNQLSKIVSDADTWTKLEYYPSGELAIVNAYWVDSDRKKIREYLVLTYNDADTLRTGVMKIYKNNIKVDEAHVTYKLNDLNQVIEISSDNEDKIPNQVITYDSNGNVESITSNNSTKSYTYNDKKSFLSNVALKYYVGINYLPVDLFNKNDIVNSVNDIEEKDFTTEYNSEDMPTSAEVEVSISGLSITQTKDYKYILR